MKGLIGIFGRVLIGALTGAGIALAMKFFHASFSEVMLVLIAWGILELNGSLTKLTKRFAPDSGVDPTGYAEFGK